MENRKDKERDNGKDRENSKDKERENGKDEERKNSKAYELCKITKKFHINKSFFGYASIPIIPTFFASLIYLS